MSDISNQLEGGEENQDGGLFGKKKDKGDKKDKKDKGDKGDKDSSGSPGCPEGQKYCFGKNLADSLIKKGDVIQAIQDSGINYLKDKAVAVKNTIVETALNPPKCALNVVTALPSAVEKMFDVIENGFNRIGNAAGNALEKSATMVLQDPIAPFKVFFYGKINSFQKLFAGILLGPNSSQILLDPNMDPGKLLEAMLKMSQSFTKIFDHPLFQKIFNEWLTNYASLFDKGVNLVLPKVTGVTEKITGVVVDTTKKLGDAIGSSLTNIIGSILKSIPFVGIIFNVGELAKKIAGKIMALCEPIVSKGGLATFALANIGVKQYNKVKCQLDNLSKKVEPIISQINGQGSKAEQSGGGFYDDHQYYKRKRAIKATRRVQRLLSQFTRRRQIKPTNYAKQLSKLRK